MRSRIVFVCIFIALGGCVYHTNERVDRTISDIASKPFDIDRDPATAERRPKSEKALAKSPDPTKRTNDVPKVAKDVEAATYLALQEPAKKKAPFELTIPEALPGSEVGPLPNIKDKAKLKEEIKRLYPPLPPLPEPPAPLPGPDGKPYTLAMLQEIAALNSPQLKQAAADVRAAEGALVQARTYPNPTMSVANQPSNDGSTPSVWGGYLAQHIITAGKMKLAIASAQKDLDNVELALRKARSDLATQVRANYFGFLVAKEAVRVNRGLSILTDEIYRTQLAYGGFVAIYEPAALRLKLIRPGST